MAFTLTIYSNDGETVLDELTFNGPHTCEVIQEGYSDSDPFGVALFRGTQSDTPSGGGASTKYFYNGDGYFRGFSTTANTTVTDELPFVVNETTNVLYVVDGTEKVRVYFNVDDVAYEDNHIIDIVKGKTGVLSCKDKVMHADINIQAPTYGENNLVEVRLGEEKILEIQSGQTGVLLCKDKIMPENVYIQYGSLEE